MATTPPATPPPPSVPPDPDALLLTAKLRLEIEQLQHQNSRGARIVDFLKNWGTPFATLLTLIALVWTIHAGVVQMGQTQNAQDQDRFDKAISRLGSGSIKERQTGAAGLSLFLSRRAVQWHGPTLRFLASALVIEDDPNVRSAILDTLRHVDAEIVTQEARDQGLQTLIESDRAILTELRGRVPKGYFNDYLALAPDAKFQKQIDALHAASEGIVILARKHTALRDFSNIYCADCDFSVSGASLDLTDAHFDRAILDRSIFSGATLSGASFYKAALLGTNFRRAILRGAHFSGTPDSSYTVQYFIATGERAEPPDLACSDLTDADFSGSLFFGVVESHDPKELVAGFPVLTDADLTNADLSKIGFYSLHLGTSGTFSAPFTNVDHNLNTYNPRHKPSLRTLKLSPSSDWTFTATSGSFVNSWRYLLSQLRSAKNVNAASLPVGFRNFEKEGYAPFTPSAGSDACHP